MYTDINGALHYINLAHNHWNESQIDKDRLIHMYSH